MFWNPLSVNVFRTLSSERRETREGQEVIRSEAQYLYSVVIFRGPLLSSCARGQRRSVSYWPENKNSIVIFYSDMRQFGAPEFGPSSLTQLFQNV
jgi:hypothetical protein